jgi:hypothetical protein
LVAKDAEPIAVLKFPPLAFALAPTAVLSEAA